MALHILFLVFGYFSVRLVYALHTPVSWQHHSDYIACALVHMYMFMFMSTSVYVYMFVSICVCEVYIYLYIFTHVHVTIHMSPKTNFSTNSFFRKPRGFHRCCICLTPTEPPTKVSVSLRGDRNFSIFCRTQHITQTTGAIFHF